jgi:hypothetical protein
VHDGQGMSVFTLNMLTVLLRLLEKNKIVSVDCKLVREYLIYIYIYKTRINKIVNNNW